MSSANLNRQGKRDKSRSSFPVHLLLKSHSSRKFENCLLVQASSQDTSMKCSVQVSKQICLMHPRSFCSHCLKSVHTSAVIASVYPCSNLGLGATASHLATAYSIAPALRHIVHNSIDSLLLFYELITPPRGSPWRLYTVKFQHKLVLAVPHSVQEALVCCSPADPAKHAMVRREFPIIKVSDSQQ